MKRWSVLALCVVLGSCASAPRLDDERVDLLDPDAVSGLWHITGQMGGRSFQFTGTLELEDVNGVITGEFKMRVPSQRVGRVGGRYSNERLLLTGRHATLLANQCEGNIRIEVVGTGSRRTGDISLDDSCSNRQFQGTIRMRR